MLDLPIPDLERHAGPIDRAELAELYERMVLIRRFEERVLALFGEGRLHGTTHACIGQEAVAVGLFSHLTAADVVFSSHRCHGHYLAHQDDPAGLMAELMGRSTGPCAGRGGSQHLHRDNFYSNGVQGGIVPTAVGMGLANRFQRAPGIAVVFLGDGTLGEGQAYESFNLASLWRVPVLFVIEHNFWSQSTPSRLQVAGSLAERPRAFGILTDEVASQDVLVTRERSRAAVEAVRRGEGPRALLFHTFRYCSHSRSDDGRPESCIAPWRPHDPILLAGEHLDPEVRAAVARRVQERVARAEEAAAAAPYAEEPVLPAIPLPAPVVDAAGGERVVQVLNRTLHELMAEDPRVVLLGEDLLDPYGGAFKVSKGLSTAYPDRVLTTPLSEASIAGVASGMALRGMRPILEIMFGDFLTLCVDQLVNYVSKFRGMYDGRASCPLVLRTPMGGRRGYGPTHSQTLDRLLLGVPDLRLVAPSVLHDPGALLREAVADEAPVVFLENKLMYTRPLRKPDESGRLGPWSSRRSAGAYPTHSLSLVDFGAARCTLATYGGMVELVLEAAEHLLIEHEIACEVVAPSLLHPEPADLAASLRRSAGRLVTVEEGIGVAGWGAEVIASCSGAGLLRGSAGRVAAPPAVIPSAQPLESRMLPDAESVVREVLRRVG